MRHLLIVAMILIAGCSPVDFCNLEYLETLDCREQSVTCSDDGRSTVVICDGNRYNVPARCEVGPDGYPMPDPSECYPQIVRPEPGNFPFQ